MPVFGRELEPPCTRSWRRRPRCIAAHWSPGPHWVQHEVEGDGGSAPSVRILPGGDAEILLVPLPGHTIGHTAVAVKHEGRWLLHCGEPSFHGGADARLLPAGAPRVPGAELGRQRQAAPDSERLQAGNDAGEVELICSHDAPTLARYQQAAGA